MSEQDGAKPTENPIEDAPTFEADKPIEGEDALGDPGKRALQTMRDQLRAAEQKLLDISGNNTPGEAATFKKKWREADKAARDARAEIDKVRREAELRDKPADEQAIENARAEARAEATTEFHKQLLRAELKAAATGKLADPTDAALYLNLDDFTVTNGAVDSDELTDAINELLTKKPHLAADDGTRFKGAGDGGAGAPPKPDESIDDAIAAARAARNFPLVATLLSQKAAKTK